MGAVEQRPDIVGAADEAGGDLAAGVEFPKLACGPVRSGGGEEISDEGGEVGCDRADFAGGDFSEIGEAGDGGFAVGGFDVLDLPPVVGGGAGVVGKGCACEDFPR